ncbi:MAG: hypothetical protein DWQ34_11200 [Planctomycetota bacterium]|nr:MAG: hypothetical protein DWQ34_11200 [Planctomycetota bacterium]REK29715.1 MAG: hypothetical protein DWQ41_03500 [Planctomycetota bacterium]REK30464.1 MAG: hypothetical protein DWQ45_21535 [Planctomycetota bacterium]
MLCTIETVEEAKGLLDKAATMQQYAERLKAGVEVERPIALGVLKIKAKLGELMPAKSPEEKGRGKKNGKSGLPFSKPMTITRDGDGYQVRDQFGLVLYVEASYLDAVAWLSGLATGQRGRFAVARSVRV